MGFPRQEYWSGLPFSLPRALPDPRIEPETPALAGGVFTTAPPGKPSVFISVQFSHSVLFDSLWPHGLQHSRLPCPSPTPGVAQTRVHRVSDAIQPSHPLSPSSPPALNLSHHQGLFQWVGSFLRWPKYWSFSFSTSLSNEYSGLISSRMDWLDLLADEGTLKSLLLHHSLKAFNSSVLSFIYGPILTSIHDYWINQSYD